MTLDDQNRWVARAQELLIQNYRQQPIVLSHGRGVELWDVAGNRYLDMTAGIAVCALGHGHPELAACIARQAERLIHTSNLYYVEEQLRLAERLVGLSFARRVFFCNSGAEANEAALKLARRWQHLVAKRPDRNLFVATHGSFHGRSFATVAITGQPKYRADLGPLVEPVEFVPYGDLAATAAILERGTACAFIVEPVQGEGGVIVAPPGYLAGLRDLCTRTGTLLLFDEVQTGVGRTGTWFGYQHDGVEPDVMTLAKGLAGGVPIGAMLASERAAAGLAALPGGAVPHASTFGGNALACAAARTVIEVIERDGLLEACRANGDYLGDQLAALAARQPDLCEGARGRGLLRGLVLRDGAAALVARCREQGLLLSITGANVVRFAPALVVGRPHIDEAVAMLEGALTGTRAAAAG